MRRVGLALLLGLGLAGFAGRVAAGDDAELEAWRQRLASAQAEFDAAQSRATAADAAYQHMRHDRSMRGDDKAKVLADRSEAQQALAEAKEQLAEVKEEARRAGAPPEWVLPDPTLEPPADH